jgi:hypothetical protein
MTTHSQLRQQVLAKFAAASFFLTLVSAIILTTSVLWTGPATIAAQAPDKGTAEIERFQHEQTLKNLRTLGIAMHNYHNDYGPLPQPAIYGKDGKPLLSWRVLLLPYLEEKELYDRFKLDEPWDSDHNKKLLEKMPTIYHPIGVETKEKHATLCQVFVGAGAVFDPPNKITLGKIGFADGASRTFLIAEAAEAVPWTKPADLPFDAKKPLPKLGGTFKDGFHACFCDCSVYFFKHDIGEKMVRQLIGWNDGASDDVDQFFQKLYKQ